MDDWSDAARTAGLVHFIHQDETLVRTIPSTYVRHDGVKAARGKLSERLASRADGRNSDAEGSEQVSLPFGVLRAVADPQETGSSFALGHETVANRV